MVIQELDLDIHHCSRKSNLVADANVLQIDVMTDPQSDGDDTEMLQKNGDELAPIINPRRMRGGYGSHCVCLCVCLSVCPHASCYMPRL